MDEPKKVDKSQCAICKRVTRRRYRAVLIYSIILTIAFAVLLTLYLAHGNIGGTTTEYDVQIHDNGGNVDSVVGDGATKNEDISGTVTEEGASANVLIICGTIVAVAVLVGGSIIYVGKNRS